MRYLLNQPIENLYDAPVIDDKGIEIMLYDALIRAALYAAPNTSGEEKMKGFLLAQKIQAASVLNAATVDLSVEQVAWLKAQVGKAWTPLVVGRVWTMLENPSGSEEISAQSSSGREPYGSLSSPRST